MEKQQQPAQAHPEPEPWTEDRPRPEWAPYDLPNSAIKLIESEQLLQSMGIREIVTGLASGSVTDFANGMEKLKALIETQRTEAFVQGLHTSRDGVGLRTMLGGIVIGASGATMIAAVVWTLLT